MKKEGHEVGRPYVVGGQFIGRAWEGRPCTNTHLSGPPSTVQLNLEFSFSKREHWAARGSHLSYNGFF